MTPPHLREHLLHIPPRTPIGTTFEANTKKISPASFLPVAASQYSSSYPPDTVWSTRPSRLKSMERTEDEWPVQVAYSLGGGGEERGV